MHIIPSFYIINYPHVIAILMADIALPMANRASSAPSAELSASSFSAGKLSLLAMANLNDLDSPLAMTNIAIGCYWK